MFTRIKISICNLKNQIATLEIMRHRLVPHY